MRETFPQRSARLAEIKQQIAAGTYETPTRLEAAVDALARKLAAPAEISDPPPAPPRRAK